MITTASLDDQTGTPVTLHRTSTRRLNGATGLLGTGPLREVLRPRPTGHGAINDTRYQDAQPISLEGLIVGASNSAALTDFHPIAAAALATLDYGPALLKWTEETGLALQRYVKLSGAFDAPLAVDRPRSIAYQLQLLASDPRAYSQTLQTITGASLSASGGGHVFPTIYPRTYTSSGGGTAAFTNAGNRKTPPVFRVYGMAVNPAVVNVTTGERITITGTIATGDYLEIDVAARSAELNGTTLRNNFIDSANTTWFELASGTTNLQMIAGSFDGSARLDILARDAYV